MAVNWTEMAPELTTHIGIHHLFVVGGDIYAISNSSGLLFYDSSSNIWIEKAPQITGFWGGTPVASCVTAVGDFYTVDSGGKLFKWDGVSAWTQLTTINIVGNGPDSLIEFGGADNIYMGKTLIDKHLYKSVSGGEFSVVATCTVAADNRLRLPLIYNGKLYFGMYSGELVEFNGIDTLSLVAGPYLGLGDWITGMTVHNNKIYAVTKNYNRLLEWNDTDAWIQRALILVHPESILSGDSEIYIGTGTTSVGYARLYRWDGDEDVVLEVNESTSLQDILSMVFHDGRVFAAGS